MPIVVQLFFGWPAIGIFLTLATLGAWLPNNKAAAGSIVFALGPSLYLFGGNNWVQLVGIYIPISLVLSIVLIRYGNNLLPKLLLVPMYCFYVWLAYAVLTQ
jgi:hypothetical protein